MHTEVASVRICRLYLYTRNKIIMKTCKLLLLALCCGCVSASAAGKAGSEAPRIVNIVNFIRNIEPRSEEITETVLYETCLLYTSDAADE